MQPVRETSPNGRGPPASPHTTRQMGSPFHQLPTRPAPTGQAQRARRQVMRSLPSQHPLVTTNAAPLNS